MPPKGANTLKKDTTKDIVDEERMTSRQSQSDENTVEGLSVTVENIVEKAVRVAMETFTSFFQKQIDELKNSIKDSTESVVAQMKSILNDRISEVDSRVVDLERKEQELDERVSQSELLINKFN